MCRLRNQCLPPEFRSEYHGLRYPIVCIIVVVWVNPKVFNLRYTKNESDESQSFEVREPGHVAFRVAYVSDVSGVDFHCGSAVGTVTLLGKVPVAYLVCILID